MPHASCWLYLSPPTAVVKGSQQLAAVALAVWAFGMLWPINRFTSVKVDEAGQTRGLDAALHGETSYLEAG